MKEPSPIRPTDDDARALAQYILASARNGALGVIEPQTGAPMVTRIATAWISEAPHILISELSQHTIALGENPSCSLLVGAVVPKGDPLNHPRLTVQSTARDANKAALRDAWLAKHPKAKLYIDFADFRMMRLEVQHAFLNGGFGRAFHLTADDLVQNA